MKFIYETDRLILKLLGEDLQFFSFISRTEMSLSHETIHPEQFYTVAYQRT
ncbi:MAG: hypothetical protein ACLVG5_13840 [Clostridium sp.]